MKSVLIFGAGAYGQFIYDLFIDSNFKIEYFADNNKMILRPIPVVSLSEAAVKIASGEIEEIWIANSNFYSLGEMIKQAHECKIDSLRIWRPEFWKENEGSPSAAVDIYRTKTDELLKKCTYLIDTSEKAVLTKLEYHVCDKCNLNCNGCSHFAPIFDGGFTTLKEFRCEVEQLSTLFSNILRFRLMGGEPFLHIHLDEYVKVVRHFFPNSRIEIVTNGLLLFKVDERVWNVIRENNVVLNISLYPPTFAIKNKLIIYLDERNISYSFGSGLEQYNENGIIEEFHKNFTVNSSHDGAEAAKHCMGSNCHYLRKGKISKCALPLLADEINQYFKLEYIVKINDYVDIFNSNLSAWEMVDLLEKETPFCNYCVESGTQRFKWKADGKIDLSDYVFIEV